MTSGRAVTTWERFIRFNRVATAAMDDHLRSAHGRTLDDYDALHQIHLRGEPMRMGELAERLLVANSSCHRIVARLVDDGLVARVEGEDDRRTVLVELTAEGRRLRRRMAATHTRDIERLLGDRLSDDELAAIDTTFDTLLSE